MDETVPPSKEPQRWRGLALGIPLGLLQIGLFSGLLSLWQGNLALWGALGCCVLLHFLFSVLAGFLAARHNEDGVKVGSLVGQASLVTILIASGAVVLFFFISRSLCHCIADIFFAPVGAGVVALAVVIVIVPCYAIGGIYLAMWSGWLGEGLYWCFAAPPLEDDPGN